MIGEHCRAYPSVWKALGDAAAASSIRHFQHRAAVTGKRRRTARLPRPCRQARRQSFDLPYGEQRRLELARALATQPRLLLLDEPAAGMNPRGDEELDEIITRVRDRGITIMLVEHDMRLVMGISDDCDSTKLRHQDRRRAAGADPGRPGRDRGIPWRGCVSYDDAGVQGLRAGYGKNEVLHESS